MRRRSIPRAARAPPAFDAQAFLHAVGPARTVMQYARGETIFSQGDASDGVLYIQTGGVKLSSVSKAGREAVVAILGPGDFFGEACLGGQMIRTGTAAAITPSVIKRLGTRQMGRLLRDQQAMADRFITHMLSRNIRIEEDLIDQLFNSSEKRLARTLLLLARYGKQAKPSGAVPRTSPDRLAAMTGATAARVAFLLSKFTRLGFITCDGAVPSRINSSLLSVVLHD